MRQEATAYLRMGTEGSDTKRGDIQSLSHQNNFKGYCQNAPWQEFSLPIAGGIKGILQEALLCPSKPGKQDCTAPQPLPKP